MDPIANMLIMIKNASFAGKKSVIVPFSKLKESIANCLLNAGYISSVSKKSRKGHPVLELGLSYGENAPKVNHVVRLSKQSKRVYLGVRSIFPVRDGKGLLVLSTPKGILTGDQARKEQVGGEALFKIW